ncbi:14573_t:CDS:2 [Entrophospora sp. SA101]|nr:14573_t:CDS:2 [Entrophospora sp. SA101]CAJ0828399.1 11138_t:CDS:2 [Entrophospora sp. SA101]CAJ0840747.1 2744_t:CDS:2 [Entrophospora sp. SA101]CAJ0868866.1 6502_t:CDS:2 [Entrophospora sp. SA101]
MEPRPIITPGKEKRKRVSNSEELLSTAAIQKRRKVEDESSLTLNQVLSVES